MSQFILLDTDVTAGILSHLGNGKDVGKTQSWVKCIQELAHKLDEPRFVIPTPVFYELAARDNAIL